VGAALGSTTGASVLIGAGVAAGPQALSSSMIQGVIAKNSFLFIFFSFYSSGMDYQIVCLTFLL
jgi:hypothetical protein